jgi:hypothetical protein
MMLARLTACVDVNCILREMNQSLQAMLGTHMVGFYLYGSLARKFPLLPRKEMWACVCGLTSLGKRVYFS